MTSVSARAQQPIRRSAGIASITTYGWNASPSRLPSSINNHPPARCPLGGQDGPALTVVVCITTPKIARPTLFVPLDRILTRYAPLLLHPRRIREPPSPPLQTHPQNSPSPLSHSATPAGTSTKAYVNARPVASVTHAQNAAIAHTASGIAPTPVDQQQLVTPIRLLQLERELANHHDTGFVGQLIASIKHGCCIGYDGPQYAHTAKHLPTAHTHTDVITAALAKECDAGRMAGPYPQPPLPNLRCSGLGVVPKKVGGWRVIYHLSAPHGSSINDFIDPAGFSLHYCTIDSAVRIINRLGPGTLMGKIDLKHAFRLMPVRREDWNLLGIHWQGHWYVDKCLPFGLRSSPALFNKLANALEWILHNNYNVERIIHYLDDFFTAGPPNSYSCQHNMDAMAQAYAAINIPINPEKTEGPTTSLTFLGILLDSATMKASITPDRKEELLLAITELHGKRTCTKRQLLSLIGKLAFTCKVVPPGRIFLRRLIDLSTTVGPIHHHITLNSEARADLLWWQEFLPEWSGSSLLLESHWSLAPDMELFTDASNLGYGAFWAGKWLSEPWPPSQQHFSIAWKELYAILVACSTWGQAWQRKRILFHCDNAAVVAIWQRGSCKCRDLISSLPVFPSRDGKLSCQHCAHPWSAELHC